MSSSFRDALRARPGMTSRNVLAAQFSPELLQIRCPSSKRGRRECRVRAAPAVSCAKVRKNGGTRAYRAAVNTPTSPAQWLYGLLRALPGGAGLLSPSPAGLLPADFSPAYAAPGPHDLTVRSRTIRLWTAASIASRAQRVVTMAIRPSGGHETGTVIILIFGKGK